MIATYIAVTFLIGEEIMKKIIAVLLLSLSMIAFSGCSSSENSDLENAFNSYTNWFESTFIDDSNESNIDDEENVEDDDIEVIAPETEISNKYSNFVLNQDNIIF